MSIKNLKPTKRRSRASQLARFIHREGKKYCAVALCATLIAGSLGSSAVAADESTVHEFELDRVALYEALQEAVMADEIVNGSFTFAGEEADAYDSLFNATDNGNLYELKPEIEDNDGPLQLRIFARLDGEIQFESAYEVDGGEEMIFLLTNTSKEEKSAVIYVDDKDTEEIKVAPGKAVLSDEELEAYKSAAEQAGPGVEGETAAAGDGVVISGGSGNGSSGGGSGSGGGSHSGGSNSGSMAESNGSIGSETKENDETGAADPTQDGTPAAGDHQGTGGTEAGDNEQETGGTQGTGNTQESGGTQETGNTQESGGTQNPETGNDATDENANTGKDENQNPAGGNDTVVDDDATGGSDGNQSEGKDSDVSGNDAEQGGTEDKGQDSGNQSGNDQNSDSQNSGGQGQEAGGSQGEAGGEQSGGNGQGNSDGGSKNDSNSSSGSSANGDSDNHSNDNGAGNVGEAGNAGGAGEGNGSSVAAVSYHKTYRVMATPSDAEKAEEDVASPSDATDSNASYGTLEGEPLEAVLLGNDASAVAFVTTLGQIGINAGGHLAPCEEGCSGEDCGCICHEVLHGLLDELDAYVNTVQGYTSETEQELFDAVLAEMSGLFERAQNAELTDAEWEYFAEAYEEALAKIEKLIIGYQGVTVILHDIQPDGTEAAEPIEVTAAADTTLENVLSETKETSALAGCNWYEVDASTGEKEPVSLDTKAEEGMELYTYTYDVTLTVVQPTVDQNAGIMTMALDDAGDDTKAQNEIETSLTISARDGETLSASDFVKDDVDYSLYNWTTDTGKTLDLQSLVENGVTENISATAYANDGIAVAAITGENEVAVGETITLSGESYYSYHGWSVMGGDGKVSLSSQSGRTISVTGVVAGEVTIGHWYSNTYNVWTNYETYKVTVKGTAGAQVYYLLSPTSNPDSNDTDQWGPSAVTHNGNNATVDTTGASWTNNKNIFKRNADLNSYIISWPDGSEGATWTLDKAQYGTVYQAVFDQYKDELERTNGITGLTLDDIEEITLVPYKISKDNSTTPDKHIDCTISVKCRKAYVASFNVQMPNNTGYTNVHTENVEIVNDQPRPVEKYTNNTTVPETITDSNGITYVFDGWYNEADQKIGEWPYTPNTEELADGTVNFYAHYVRPSVNVSIKKVVSGIMGDRSKKFRFTVASDTKDALGVDSWTFEIAHNGTEDLGSIPVGAKLTISETNAATYVMSVDKGIKKNDYVYEYTITNNEDGSIIIKVTNQKSGNVDAGVLLDSLPYVLILAAVAAGVAFFVIRKRREDESDLD